MNAKHLIPITLAAALVAAAPSPAEAGGSFGIHVSNHGFGLSFGTSNWGIWGSSWDTGYVSVGFTSALDGYGEWVWVDGLGRVWRPWVAVDWQPYSYGRWVWTSHGWTWVAYEPWGWVPHHYGNWAFTTVGWVWTPGYTYHPGNVVWVGSGAYIGWYPRAPNGWSHAHRAYNQGWNAGYNHGYHDGWMDARYATWVPRTYVTSENVSHHVVTHTVVTRSVARNQVTPLAAPPSRSDVERMVGRSVPEARLVERTAKVDGRDIRVVRPEGQSETVRRYGTDTVERALSPVARERVTGSAIPTYSRGDVETQRSRSPAYAPVKTQRSDARPSTRDRVTRIPDSTQSRRVAETQRTRTSNTAPAQAQAQAPRTSTPSGTTRSRSVTTTRTRETTVSTTSRSTSAPSSRRAPQAVSTKSTATNESVRSSASRSRTTAGGSSEKKSPSRRRRSNG